MFIRSSSTPESLGLQHLAIRPKKQQLIEDRRQTVAKENAKLMGLMTKVFSSYHVKKYNGSLFITQIMNDKRPQPNYVRPNSLNELERKRNVDKLNFENKMMSDRLRKVPPVISKSSLEEDFEKHLKAEANLRRRQMKPMGLPKDLHHASSVLFDATTYSAQQMNYSPENEYGSNSPIKSMTEFRKHVISSKKSTHNMGKKNGNSISLDNLSRDFELSHQPR
jgi:hypothetical protein